MANYQNLKNSIAQVIKTNGNQEITGQLLKNTLNNIVTTIGTNYTFAGVATPATNPGTPDQNVFYLAGDGTYTNFGNKSVAAGNIGILKYNGTWSLDLIKVGGDVPINELNISKMFPTEGTGGSNKYTLVNAIAKVPNAYKDVIGLKITFLSDESKVETYAYQGGTFTSAESWEKASDISNNPEFKDLKSFFSGISSHGKEVLIDGGYITSSGRVQKPQSGYSYTEFIEMPEKIKTISINTRADALTHVCIYDSRKTLIKSYGSVNGLKDLTADYKNTWRYIRLTCRNNYYNQFNVLIEGFSMEETMRSLESYNRNQDIEINETSNRINVESWNTQEEKFDFAIGDKNNNIILLLEDGHILTKSFSSKGGNALLRGKKLSVVGDSISSFTGYQPSDKPGYEGELYERNYPSGGVSNINEMYFKQICDLNKMTLLQAAGWSGSRVCGNSTSDTSARVATSNKRISDLSYKGDIPDIVLVYIGINDYRATAEVGNFTLESTIPAEGDINTFSEAYALLISKIIAAYPKAKIVCATLMPMFGVWTGSKDDFPYKNGRVYLESYNEKIRLIAKYFGIGLAELPKIALNKNNYKDYLADGLHPSVKGQAEMARIFNREILKL